MDNEKSTTENMVQQYLQNISTSWIQPLSEQMQINLKYTFKKYTLMTLKIK